MFVSVNVMSSFNVRIMTSVLAGSFIFLTHPSLFATVVNHLNFKMRFQAVDLERVNYFKKTHPLPNQVDLNNLSFNF